MGVNKKLLGWLMMMWIHILVMYQIAFSIDIDNVFQRVILIISPLSTLIVLLSFVGFIKGRNRRYGYMFILTLLLNFLMYANKVFYTFFNDFITIPLLFQTSNFSDLGSSSTGSLIGFDIILYFIPTIVVLVYWAYQFKTKPKLSLGRNYKGATILLLVGLGVGMINLAMSESERPELLTRSFDREILVKNINLYNYHIFDLVTQINIRHNRAVASTEDYARVFNQIHSNKVSIKKSKLDGLGKGKNIIHVNLESLQNFMLYQKAINKQTGKEEYALPYLRSLMSDKDVLYFDNYFPQIGQGKTSDSEFIIDTGLYPLDRGAVFFTHGDNKYSTLTQNLKGKGLVGNVYHANDETFWNRKMVYKSFGVEKFYDVDSYDVSDDTSVNWGLKDKEFFNQTVKLLKSNKEEGKSKEYAKMITLTNHYPFILDDKDATVKKYNTNSDTLNSYVQTARYLDESIKLLISDLKKEGLYKDSIIILSGDHRGISENHNKAMEELTSQETTSVKGVEYEKTPLFIIIPDSNINNDKKKESVLISQLDLRPMISAIYNIDLTTELYFGENPIDKDGRNKPYVMLRDGRMIVQLKGKNYYKLGKDKPVLDTNNLEVSDSHVLELINNYYEQGERELKVNDELILKDLLKFKH